MISNKVEFEIYPDRVNMARTVIEKFVALVHANEPGTRLYHAFQHQDKPSCFTHFMVFENTEAEEIHRNSEYCLSFVKELYPLCKQEPVFTKLNYVK